MSFAPLFAAYSTINRHAPAAARDRMNGALPKQIDFMTKLVPVRASGITVSYVYEFNKLGSWVYSRVCQQNALGLEIHALICTNGSLRQDVEGRGVSLRISPGRRSGASA